MVSIQDIGACVRRSQVAVSATLGRFIASDRMDGDEETAVTASVTRYYNVGIAPFPGALVAGFIRAKAAGVGATTTFDLLKVPSGTAVTAGVAMVTQVALNGLTANTNYALAVKSDGSQNVNAGDSIVMKVVTQAGETLTPITATVHIE